jgi:hypothetical protein
MRQARLDQRPKCKSSKYEIHRRKFRTDIKDVDFSNDFSAVGRKHRQQKQKYPMGTTAEVEFLQRKASLQEEKGVANSTW